MGIKKLLALLSFIFLYSIKIVNAHCPLCTIGAAAAAGGAAWLGVNNVIIGLFIGAFAISIGYWISKLIKKQYIPFQKTIIILISFLTTILPLLPMMNDIYPFYLSLSNDYGSLLNRTYLINLFLIGSILGSIVVSLTPWLSSKITKLRNGKIIPFQGVVLTLVLLIILASIIQVVM